MFWKHGSFNDGMKRRGDTGYEIIESKISLKMVKNEDGEEGNVVESTGLGD